MATYLLTGCAGFIASNVADFLLKDNHTVIGIDNLNDAYDVRLNQLTLLLTLLHGRGSVFDTESLGLFRN